MIVRGVMKTRFLVIILLIVSITAFAYSGIDSIAVKPIILKMDKNQGISFRDVIPALSALFGGLMVFLGSMCTSYYINASKKKKVIRNKLEEAYVLILEINDWFRDVSIKLPSISKNETKIITDSYYKINTTVNKTDMLIACYVRKTNRKETLIKAISDLQSKQTDYIYKLLATGIKNKQLYHDIDESEKNCEKLIEDLLKNIRAEIILNI